MGKGLNIAIPRSGISIFVILLCLVAMPAPAAEKPALGTARTNFAQDKNTIDPMRAPNGFTAAGASPFQLIRDNHDAGLNFDLGGSDVRKLQLQLGQPLTLSAGSHAQALDSGANQLGLDATLDLPLNNNFSLTAGAGQQLSQAHFQSLGSIRCMNGILRPDSYTASGCQFVDESFSSAQSSRINFGARFDTNNASASINWFTQNSELSSPGARQLNMTSGVSVSPDRLLMPGLSDPLLVSSTYSDPLQQFRGQTTGVDLDFRVGIATDNHGDIRLGLAFSHVLDANYQGIYSNSQNPLSWTLAEPFNSARMSLEWGRGNFSSGIRGFYREPVNFLNRNSVDDLTTFDVHFTWKTPWNGNLSVGATNVLNGGGEPFSSARESNNGDLQPIDPLESIYGRIPYVRYKQDL
jgi:hypothetical protein